MNTNSIKYRFITHWYEKKSRIVGLFGLLCIALFLFLNIGQRYQILLKEIHNVLNRFTISFLLFLFVSAFLFLLSALIVIQLFKKSIGMNPSIKSHLKNEGKFETLFKFYPLGAALVDIKTGGIVEVNAKFCKMLGYEQEEIMGDHYTSIFTQEISDTKSPIELITNKKATEHTTKTELLTRSGQAIWVKLTALPLYEPNKTPHTAIVYIEDIASKKNGQKSIEANGNCTKSIINALEGIVWECDAKSLKTYFISEKIESLLGYTVTESLQLNDFWKNLLHQNDMEWVMREMQQAVKDTAQHTLEFRMIAKNGKTVWIKNVFYFENENGSCIKGIMTNISKTKEVEKELKKTIRLVTEQNNKLINFSHIVSHNLRSHTSNIESISNFIETTKSAEEQEQMIELLKSASSSLNQTVYDLNNVINVKTKINLVSKSLNLNHYITDTEKTLADQIHSSGTTIVNLIPDNLMINYNPACLESILYNLISNALRFKHPDRSPIITLKWLNEKNINILEISDNGTGIDLTKNADKIFGMYNTFHENTKSKGMGLFTTKNQIEAMGGSISVESSVNIGTTFKLTFP